MEIDKYLNDVLESQTLDEDGDEMKALRKRRVEVEKLLREKFSESNPAIGYAGSYKKGTMNRESYDLDITCYFKNSDSGAGESLKDIYENMSKVLGSKYVVEPKPSALRLKGLDQDVHGTDFHIDVVPGRFTEDDTNVYLHRQGDDKVRLKTNPEIHVSHVRDSGVQDAIRLAKLWRDRNGIEIKTFVLELLVIDLLKDKKDRRLQTQLRHLWTELRDHAASISVKDPANPEGNDLSEFLSERVRVQLKQVSERTLRQVDNEDWETIFGKIDTGGDSGRAAALAAAIASRQVAAAKPFKPYAGD